VNLLDTAFVRLVADLRALKVEWALVGGMAVSYRSRPRTTEDLDVAIAVVGDREAESIARGFRSRGYHHLPESVLEHRDAKRLATVRFAATAQDCAGVVVDLLFSSSGIEPELVASAEVLEILPRVSVPVALTGHLLAMKILAGREQDVRDAQWLWEAADETEKQRARDALILITHRRYNRGKDLFSEMARILGSQP